MPISDRDYMRRSPQPSRRSWMPGGSEWFKQNPLLVIIALNFLMFLATSIQPNLKETLGLVPMLFLERFWTIITCIFVHEGFMHFFFNMLALFIFGNTLIKLIKPGKFLLVYFLGGIVGSILFLSLNISMPYLMIGASGAVYAVAGALVIMVPKMQIALWGIIPMPLWIFVLVFLGLLSLPPFVSTGIAWEAHIGGLVTGLIAGFIFRKSGRYHY
jgi:membrane associated rhomboid family serine protease